MVQLSLSASEARVFNEFSKAYSSTVTKFRSVVSLPGSCSPFYCKSVQGHTYQRQK